MRIMKLKFYAFIGFLLLIPFFTYSQSQKIVTIFKKVDEKLATINNMTYEMDYIIKSFSSPTLDTYKVDVVIKRVEDDPMGVYFKHTRIQNIDNKKDTIERIYNGNLFYKSFLNDTIPKVIDIYDKHKIALSGLITGDSETKYLLLDFFKKKNLSRYNDVFIKVLIKSKTLEDTIINQEPCYKITIKVKNVSQFQDVVIKQYIRKSDFMIVGYENIAALQGLTDHNAYFLKIKAINAPLAADAFLIDTTNQSTSELTQPAIAVSSANDLLKIGSVAPSFKFTAYNDSVINMDDLRGKIVILDFWYIGCFYCIKAMPALNKLSGEYADKEVVFLSINLNDNKEQVANYFKKNNYTILY